MTAPPRACILCTAPRSGSTLLCRMLQATGAAGRPGSHFHAPSLAGWLAAYDLDAAAFPSETEAARAVFARALARGRAGGDLFALRLQRASAPHFLQRLEALHPGPRTDVARIEAAFGPTRFIHLSRADRLGQALSRVRAEQTGLWHRNADGSELERLAPPAPPRYDRAAIARAMEEAEALDAAWTAWFSRENLAPLRLDYAELARDPQAVLAQVLSFLGLDPALAATVEPPTARLADAETARWRRRFETEPAA